MKLHVYSSAILLHVAVSSQTELVKASSKLVEAAFRQHQKQTTANSNDLLSQRAALVSEMIGAELSDGDDVEVDDRSTKAIKEFNPANEKSGRAAWKFLKLLSSSPNFIAQFWQAKPLLIRSWEVKEITKQDGGANWIDGSFTLEDLQLVDGSYISGSRTDDILRKGIKTDSWAFRPIKSDPTRKTTWNEVEDALKGGTIYFNSAGSFWPSLGSLCRLTSYAFGLPTNVNIYITPPGSVVSVPPHTDRQDVLVFQTQGSKRWRVYNPPKRVKGKDPLNRGKGGDVLSPSDLGVPLLDIILRRGDVLYVPAGYPHITDTNTIVDHETVPAEDQSQNDLFDETSVHLTMGLDSHVWALTYAHVRWSLLQRCGKDWKLEIKNDSDYWGSMRTLPIGFLSGGNSNSVNLAIEAVKKVLIQLEPRRWETESFPSDVEIKAVVEYMFEDHLGTLMEIQDMMFSDIDPHDESTIIKGYQCTQKQDAVMQRYGAFSNNEAMKNAFEKRRLDRQKKASSASKEL